VRVQRKNWEDRGGEQARKNLCVTPHSCFTRWGGGRAKPKRRHAVYRGRTKHDSKHGFVGHLIKTQTNEKRMRGEPEKRAVITEAFSHAGMSKTGRSPSQKDFEALNNARFAKKTQERGAKRGLGSRYGMRGDQMQKYNRRDDSSRCTASPLLNGSW